jgi:glycerate 2-kinase
MEPKRQGDLLSEALANVVVGAARTAIATLSGERRVTEALARRPARPSALIAVGKAAAAMAEGALGSLGPMPGIVVCRDAPPVAPEGCDLVRAGHPRPDEASVAATRAVLHRVAALGPEDELIALISGGTSALIGGPIAGVALEEMIEATDRLLRAGEPIDAINAVRRRLGAALGGRLGAATRARVRLMIVSDVADDDPRVVGSGPFSSPPAADAERAIEVARRVGLPAQLIGRIASAQPSPAALAAALDDRVDGEIIARPADLAAAAARALGDIGLHARCGNALVQGPVETLAAELVEAARDLRPGEAVVRVGEPTVVVRGPGRGGRAQHCAALVALGIEGLGDRVCLALGSDGSDGPTDAAGAVVDGESAGRARSRGIDLGAVVDAFDSHAALDALGALVRTGPTGTNLTDLYVVARAMLPAT